MSFLTQEAFQRADKERLGSFLTQEAFDRANTPKERLSDLGCPCGTLYGMGCAGCNGKCKGMGDLGKIPFRFPGRRRRRRRGQYIPSPVIAPLVRPSPPPFVGWTARPSLPGSLTMEGLGLAPTDPLAQIPALQEATAEAQKVSTVISPWLWVFSVIGFGLGLLNTKRVDAMWKRYGGSKFKGMTKPKF